MNIFHDFETTSFEEEIGLSPAQGNQKLNAEYASGTLYSAFFS